jgi:hypothetical protein
VSRRALLLAGALAIVALALCFVAIVGHRPLAYVTRDPQATTLERWFLGFFSNVGSALWWAAAAIAIFAGCVLVSVGGDTGTRERACFMFAIGGLGAVLAADDMFGIHDIWGFAAGVPEWPFFALYGALALGGFWFFRADVARTWVAPLVLAVVLYAFSTVVDWMSGHSESDLRYLGEDGVKLLAIVCWLAWVGHSAFGALRSAPRAGGPADEPVGGLPYD